MCISLLPSILTPSLYDTLPARSGRNRVCNFAPGDAYKQVKPASQLPNIVFPCDNLAKAILGEAWAVEVWSDIGRLGVGRTILNRASLSINSNRRSLLLFRFGRDIRCLS